MQTADIEHSQYTPAIRQYIQIRQRRKSLDREYRLITQNGLDVRLQIIKRKTTRKGYHGHEYKVYHTFVNGQYYPEPTRYGYRITGLPHRTMTKAEALEFGYNWNLIMQSERE